MTIRKNVYLNTLFFILDNKNFDFNNCINM